MVYEKAVLTNGSFPTGYAYPQGGEANFGIGDMRPGAIAYLVATFKVTLPDVTNGCRSKQLVVYVTPAGFGAINTSVLVHIVSDETIGSLGFCDVKPKP
jgi:hypothetical protein